MNGTASEDQIKAARRRQWEIHELDKSSFNAAAQILRLLVSLRAATMANKPPASGTAVSQIESDFFDALYQRGVPEACRSPQIMLGDGTKIPGKPDGWWDPTPTQRVSLFVDGYYWHVGKTVDDMKQSKTAAEAERLRKRLLHDNDVTTKQESLGITVIRVDDEKGEFGLGTKEGFEAAADMVAQRILKVLNTPQPAEVAEPEPVPEPAPEYVEEDDEDDDDGVIVLPETDEEEPARSVSADADLDDIFGPG